MRRPRPTSTPNHFVKRLILCLLLGAILQYAVAVGFVYSAEMPPAKRRWHVRIPMHGWECSIIMCGGRSRGCDVLESFCTYGSEILGAADFDGRADFSRSQWIEYDWRAHPLLDSPSSPPSWSRLASVTHESISDDLRASLWGNQIEWAGGWPMRSAACRLYDGGPAPIAFDGWMLDPGASRGTTPRSSLCGGCGPAL